MKCCRVLSKQLLALVHNHHLVVWRILAVVALAIVAGAACMTQSSISTAPNAAVDTSIRQIILRWYFLQQVLKHTHAGNMTVHTFFEANAVQLQAVGILAMAAHGTIVGGGLALLSVILRADPIFGLIFRA